MNTKQSLTPDINPLDTLVTNGGFTGIFRTIGCIGDSLSSGEFQSTAANGNYNYHDMYEYSWGQYMAREAGCKVFNFSRGGMTAREFNASFGKACGFQEPENICQAYIIALGVNDVFNSAQPVGEVGDCEKEDYSAEKLTFSGEYETIIQKIKTLQPKARVFLMTPPRGRNDEKAAQIQTLLMGFAEKYEFTYVIDLFKYAPVYDEEFRSKYYLSGHMNPMGYMLTARYVMTYIDYIIRTNVEDFKQVPFIGLPYHSAEAKW